MSKNIKISRGALKKSKQIPKNKKINNLENLISYSIKDIKNDIWSIIDSMFNRNNGKHLILHQVASYNYFVDNLLEILLKQFNPITLSYNWEEELKNYKYELQINIIDFFLDKPTIHENNGSTKTMYPNDARLRNLTYSSNLSIELEVNTFVRTFVGDEQIKVKKGTKKLNNICIGNIPIMLHSKLCSLVKMNNKTKQFYKECKYDLGGYFIINGSEKVVVSQERTAENKIYVFKTNKNSKKYSQILKLNQ